MLDAIRRQFASWIDPERRTLGISPRIDPSAWNGIFGRPTHSGVKVTEANVLGIAAFWRGVNLYASTIGALDLQVMERDRRGGFSPARSHPIYDLLASRPNRTTPKLNFWQSIISHALTFRGGFAEIEWGSRSRVPLGLHLMDPRSTKPIFNKDRSVEYRFDVGKDPLDSADVVHIRGLAFNGIEGYSLVELANESLGLAKAQLIHEAAVFGNGAQMGGVLEMPGTLTEAQKSAHRDNWNSVHQGPGNSGKIGILSGGAKWVQTNFSPADAQLILSRGFSVAEIARILGIPLHMLNVMEGATVGNAEQQAIQFVKFSLIPWLKSIEGELELKLFSPQERRRFCIRHDTNTLERGDMASRTAYYTGLFNLAAITPNQIMLAEGMTPISDPNADKHFFPANNLTTLEDWDGKPTQPASSKPPESDLDGKELTPAEGDKTVGESGTSAA
jgi:HK97 family phage portal protein